MSVGTLHNIHVIYHVQSTCGSILNKQWIVTSMIDDTNSSDARAILAQIPCDFNGGEICRSVGTQHNIHVFVWNR
jgi:hypothetical protein